MVLQKWGFELNQICKENNVKIATEKTKVMEFQSDAPVRTKIINDRLINQYLVNDIDCDADMKLYKFQTICTVIDRVVRNRIHREIKIIFVNLGPSLDYIMVANYVQ